MTRIYVLDTNVLLHDPCAFKRFEDNIVVIPVPVLQELEAKKTAGGILGANSRIVARELEKFIASGVLSEGVPLNDKGGTLMLMDSPDSLSESTDEKLIATASYLQRAKQGMRVCLITKDKYLKILANYRGIRCEDYRNDYVESAYSGQKELQINSDLIEDLFAEGQITLTDLSDEPINLCVKLIDIANEKHTALAIHKGNGKLELVDKSYGRVLSLKALNCEQRFALRLLLDPDIHLVTLSGATGSGKTLLSVAAALEQVERKIYKQIVSVRSEVSIGNSQGFLAGSIKEKTDPWHSSIHGCLEQIVGCKDSGKETSNYRSADFLTEKGILRSEALAYIRGVTWHQTILIMDESQNSTLRELKAVLTRAGGAEGGYPTKVILLGDTDQIDNPYLDSQSNGLSKVVNAFTGWGHYAHLSLHRTVRSDLSREAGRRLM